jgi:membrane protease YdiL (CAAX protease family)
MTAIQTFIKRHPVLAYYVLTFAISWGGGLLMIGGPGSIPGPTEQVERLQLFMLLVLFAGPSVSGILLTGLVDGREGYRELLTRLLRWRVGIHWYAVALLTAPLVFTVVFLALSLFSPAFLPSIFSSGDPVSLLVFGIVWGLIGGGLLEETGWTGFAVPRLRQRHGVLTTALIVGVLWGTWHFVVIFWMSGSTLGGLPLALFLTVRGLDLLIGQLPAYRVLLVWVYDRTGGSLLVTMLMHASLSASMLIFRPLPTLSGVLFLAYCITSSVALWLVVAAVAVASRGRLARQQPRRRAA